MPFSGSVPRLCPQRPSAVARLIGTRPGTYGRATVSRSERDHPCGVVRELGSTVRLSSPGPPVVEAAALRHARSRRSLCRDRRRASMRRRACLVGRDPRSLPGGGPSLCSSARRSLAATDSKVSSNRVAATGASPGFSARRLTTIVHRTSPSPGSAPRSCIALSQPPR